MAEIFLSSRQENMAPKRRFKKRCSPSDQCLHHSFLLEFLQNMLKEDKNRTHPQTPPKLSSLECIKFQPLENKDKRKLVVWRKLFIFGDRNMSYLAS